MSNPRSKIERSTAKDLRQTPVSDCTLRFGKKSKRNKPFEVWNWNHFFFRMLLNGGWTKSGKFEKIEDARKYVAKEIRSCYFNSMNSEARRKDYLIIGYIND